MSKPNETRTAKVLYTNAVFRAENAELKQTLVSVTDYIGIFEKASTILENSLVAHGAQLVEKDAQYQTHLAEKDAQYQAQLEEKDAQYQTQLAEKDAKLAEKDAKLAETDAYMKNFAHVDSQLAALQAKKDARQAERDARQAERDALQARTDAEQVEKDACIKEEAAKAEAAYEKIFGENFRLKGIITDLQNESFFLSTENYALKEQKKTMKARYALQEKKIRMSTIKEANEEKIRMSTIKEDNEAQLAENSADCKSYIEYCIIIFVALISLCLILALAVYYMGLLSETEQAHTEQTEEYPVFINHCFSFLAPLYPLQCYYELSKYIVNEIGNLNISVSEI